MSKPAESGRGEREETGGLGEKERERDLLAWATQLKREREREKERPSGVGNPACYFITLLYTLFYYTTLYTILLH